MKKDEPFVFDGFEPANTTPVPDVLFDELLPYLNEAQLKVMLYIIRRTLGFKKTADAISLKQFRYGITTKDEKKLDSGCGLKNFTTISKALKSLEQMGCIESDKRETSQGDQDTTVYRIRFRGTAQNVVPTTVNVVGVLRKTDDRTTPSGVGVLRKTEPQETVRQETVRQRESIAPASLSAFAERKKTTGEHPAITPEMLADTAKREAITLPSKQKPAAAADGEAVVQPPQSQVNGTPDVAPPASVARGTAQAGAGAELPPMALTPKQIAKQNEKRAREIWAIIERELGTTFTQTQRKSDFNTKGMQNLIEDQISDEQLITALSKLDDFGVKNFNLKRFHEMMPGLLAARKHNGKPASRDEPESFVSKTLDKERNDRRIQEMIEKSHKIRAERSAQAI